MTENACFGFAVSAKHYSNLITMLIGGKSVG
jgi:hypothetical protein